MTLHIDVLADGGLRVHTPGINDGLTSLRMAREWIRIAADRRWQTTVRGAAGSTLVDDLLETAHDVGVTATMDHSAPSPWPKGRTSLQVAAGSGLVEQARDLIDRGSPLGAPRPWQLSPYRLAMRAGRVEVLSVLRAAGVKDPVRVRPPGAPDAIVLRPFIGRPFYWLALLLGGATLIGGVVTTTPAAIIAGLVIGVALAGVGLLADVAVGRTTIGIDGSVLWMRRLGRWQGPVDLRRLVAVGIREPRTFNSAALLRLANDEGAGEPVSRSWSHGGFDPPIVDALRERADIRILTISMTAAFLRPGLERFVAGHLGDETMVSSSMQPVVDVVQAPRETGRPT